MSSMTIAEERELVRAAQQGDQNAAGRLWDEFSPRVFGYVLHTLGNRHAAEDVLQTTWLKALQHLPRYNHGTVSFSAWLFAIAKNECRQLWRKHVPDPLDEALETEPAGDAQGALLARLTIDQILTRLSPDDQEILRLRYIADLSTKDLAKTLNLNFVAARVRLSRALARAKALAEEGV